MVVFRITNHYQTATHLHQLLEPDTSPRNYSVAQRSSLLYLANDHDIQKVAVCIWYNLDINRVIQLSVEQWEWIWRGCCDLCIWAIYSTNDILQSSYKRKSTINFSIPLEARDSKRTVKCLTSLLSLSEMIMWPKRVCWEVWDLTDGCHCIIN